MNNIAGINLAQTYPSAHGSGDAAINQVHLGTVDLSLVRLDGTLVLMYQRFLGFKLLSRYGVLFPKLLITLKVKAGITQKRPVADQLSFVLSKLCLERPRIKRGQQVPAFDKLSSLKYTFISCPSIRE